MSSRSRPTASTGITPSLFPSSSSQLTSSQQSVAPASGTVAGSGQSSWTWGGGFEDDDEENEDGDEDSGFSMAGGRDGVIFLIDATAAMLADQDDGKSFFSRAIAAAHNTLANKIISSDKDLVSIVLFGTDKHKNNSDFPHIYVLQDLDTPDARRIRELDVMMKDTSGFAAKFGHSDDYSLNDALWACSNILAASTAKMATKRILIFTCNDSPHQPGSALQRQAYTKARDLRDVGIIIDLLQMTRPGQPFNIKAFYSDVVTADDTPASTGASGFESLLTRVRAKVHKKRALMRIPFTLFEGLELGVSVYSLAAETKKASHVWLQKTHNLEVSSRTKYVCAETAAPLLPADIKFGMEYGKERIVFEKDEVAQMKQFAAPGLVLMGFKPAERVKPQYNVHNSYFMYPDETTIQGSTTLFTALHHQMLAGGKSAICRFIPRINSAPYFVALLAQEAVVDDSGSQTIPPGFHVIFLPFADDMRKLKYEPTKKASDPQVEIMERVIEKLDFKAYTVDSFENPDLQKHYKNLEALALDKEEPENVDDTTEPNVEFIEKRAGALLREFSEITFPDGYVADATAKKAAPRKTKVKDEDGDDGEPSAKRAKPVVVDAEVVKAHFYSGTLGKLTVPALKEFCRQSKMKPKLKKDELVEQVEEHFSK